MIRFTKEASAFSFTGNCGCAVIPVVKDMKTGARRPFLRSLYRALSPLIFLPFCGVLWLGAAGCSHFDTSRSVSRPWLQNYEGYSTNRTILQPGTKLYGK